VEPLQHDLLGRLGVDPAERFLVELFRLDEIARLRARLEGLGLRHADLGRGSSISSATKRARKTRTLPDLCVDADVDVLVARGPAVRGLDRLLDGPKSAARVGPPSQRSAAGGRRRNLDSFRASRFINSAATRRPARQPLNKRRGGHPRQERPVDLG